MWPQDGQTSCPSLSVAPSAFRERSLAATILPSEVSVLQNIDVGGVVVACSENNWDLHMGRLSYSCFIDCLKDSKTYILNTLQYFQYAF